MTAFRHEPLGAAEHHRRPMRTLASSMLVTLVLTTAGCCVFASLAACGSTEKNNTNTVAPPPARPTADDIRIADTGHWAAAQAFIAACFADDAASVRAMLTPWALNAIERCHGTLGVYCAQLRTRIGQPAKVAGSPEVPFPFQIRGDDGAYLIAMIEGRGPVSFYLVPHAGGFKVDNIIADMDTSRLIIAEIAPAFSLSLSDPTEAFVAYYYGAFFGVHPSDFRNARKGPLATQDERLAYLYLCSTDEFMTNILRDPEGGPDLVRFLDTGRIRLFDNFEIPDIPKPKDTDGKSVIIEMVPKDSAKPNRVRYTTRREHGLCRLLKEELVAQPE